MVDTKLKSVPVTEAAVGTVTLSAPMPVFVSVVTAVLLAPTCVVVAKPGVVNDADWACPVPARVMVVAPPPLSTNVRVPERAPEVDGVKLAVMTQVALTATVAQVLDWPKSAAPLETLIPENTRALVPVFVTVTACGAGVEATC